MSNDDQKLKKRSKRTRAKPDGTLPQRWEPKLFSQADSRMAIVRELRRRVDVLKEEAGVDSFAKTMLAERAIFLATWLETQEREAIEGESFDSAKWIQGLNALTGCLRTLGLEKKAKTVTDLKTYVSGRAT